jgi:hypothetical protein
MSNVEEILNLLDRGGVIVILIFIIYQGKKIIDNQTQKLTEVSKESNLYIKEMIKTISKIEK